MPRLQCRACALLTEGLRLQSPCDSLPAAAGTNGAPAFPSRRSLVSGVLANSSSLLVRRHRTAPVKSSPLSRNEATTTTTTTTTTIKQILVSCKARFLGVTAEVGSRLATAAAPLEPLEAVHVLQNLDVSNRANPCLRSQTSSVVSSLRLVPPPPYAGGRPDPKSHVGTTGRGGASDRTASLNSRRDVP